jgi:hypothetical protein
MKIEIEPIQHRIHCNPILDVRAIKGISLSSRKAAPSFSFSLRSVDDLQRSLTSSAVLDSSSIDESSESTRNPENLLALIKALEEHWNSLLNTVKSYLLTRPWFLIG